MAWEASWSLSVARMVLPGGPPRYQEQDRNTGQQDRNCSERNESTDEIGKSADHGAPSMPNTAVADSVADTVQGPGRNRVLT